MFAFHLVEVSLTVLSRVDRARLSREPRIAPAELITGVSAFAASGYARQRCGGTFRELGYVGKTPGTTCASHPRRDARCRWGHVRQEPMALDPAYYAGVPAGGSRAGPAVRPCRCRRAPLAFSAPIMSPQAAFGNTPLRAEVLVDRRDAGIARRPSSRGLSQNSTRFRSPPRLSQARARRRACLRPYRLRHARSVMPGSPLKRQRKLGVRTKDGSVIAFPANAAGCRAPSGLAAFHDSTEDRPLDRPRSRCRNPFIGAYH